MDVPAMPRRAVGGLSASSSAVRIRLPTTATVIPQAIPRSRPAVTSLNLRTATGSAGPRTQREAALVRFGCNR